MAITCPRCDGHQPSSTSRIERGAHAADIAINDLERNALNHRERQQWAAPGTPSFPSGHATVAMAVAALEGMRSRRIGWGLGALAIGLSRVRLQHHFVSDVVVGWTVGGATGLLACGAFFADTTVRPSWSWWLWPQLSVVVFAIFTAYLSLMRFGWLSALGVDKLMHFILYGLLALLLSAFVRRQKIAALSALVLLATIEEWLQAWSPARTFDLLDLTCTLSGIVLLAALGVWVTSRRSSDAIAPAAYRYQRTSGISGS